MAAPKGNKFYLLAEKKPGAPKMFKTPDDLWKAFTEYKQYTDDNPWIMYDVVKTGKDTGKLLPMPHQRPYTLMGFAVYLGTSFNTLYNYKEKYKDFFNVYTRIDDECRTQKFQGASVGAFNANIIARDLGLADKKDLSSEDGSMSPKISINVSDSKTKDEIDKLK